MESFEPKKLALLRILAILQDNTDADHPMKQEQIAQILEKEYGIVIERKAIGRNISLLREAGYEIASTPEGCYLAERLFEDSELRLLIDSVLSSKHITASHSKELIDKLRSLSNKHFRRHIRNIYSAGEWDRSENASFFYNIDLIDEAIEAGKMVKYNYNKFGTDKKLHRSSFQRVTPYQMILHNQHYYLMGYSPYWDHMVFHRLDRITNMQLSSWDAVPLREVKGYENGIDYKKLSTTMPYMFHDEPVQIVFEVTPDGVDPVVDWFGKDIRMEESDGKITVTLWCSPNAMVYWGMQYADCVKVISPVSIRDRIHSILVQAVNNYEAQ